MRWIMARTLRLPMDNVDTAIPEFKSPIQMKPRCSLHNEMKPLFWVVFWFAILLKSSVLSPKSCCTGYLEIIFRMLVSICVSPCSVFFLRHMQGYIP
ncbi:hypothetical protein L208DRAFT_422092 [Tricholoma matsutake]|nr:hypothetical protein L208DRAFT_422092 [Tricholoma matsutake 945]